ncbi:MAG: hypothetical protein LJE68_07455 [Rhodobacter sp.]|nr:hypothetical protein [Rhodobacter sp.]
MIVAAGVANSADKLAARSLPPELKALRITADALDFDIVRLGTQDSMNTITGKGMVRDLNTVTSPGVTVTAPKMPKGLKSN